MSTEILKPPALKPGDTIGIIAPASPVPTLENLHRGMRFWLESGYQVHFSPTLYRTGSFLAGDDATRLADLHQMFLDPEIKALICLRGGYGTLRLLADIDYNLIASHPKILVGYSDITALHLALNKMTGLVTFHGPMLYPELGSKEVAPYTKQSLLDALSTKAPLGLIPLVSGIPAPITIVPGEAEGRVLGGNLSLITATLGTPYEIDTKGNILFLEDVDEAPYRLDRMLTQLQLAGKLATAAGIIFGHCTRCDDPDKKITSLEVIAAQLLAAGRPAIYGFPAGHMATQATLPLGVRAYLDADTCSLTYTEAALV